MLMPAIRRLPAGAVLLSALLAIVPAAAGEPQSMIPLTVVERVIAQERLD